MSKKMNVGLLRQWLNEDRINDPDKMVTNEMLERWLVDECTKKVQVKFIEEERKRWHNINPTALPNIIGRICDIRLVDESECEHDWQSCSDNFGNAWEQCIKCNQIKCNQKKESEPNPVANESYANENTESKKIEKPPILDHSMTDFYDVLDNRELMIKIINHLNKDL